MFTRYLKTLDLDALSVSSVLIKNYLYNLKREQKTEAPIICFQNLKNFFLLNSEKWQVIHGEDFKICVDCKFKVSYRGSEITLSEVRNLAYEHDADVKKRCL